MKQKVLKSILMKFPAKVITLRMTKTIREVSVVLDWVWDGTKNQDSGF